MSRTIELTEEAYVTLCGLVQPTEVLDPQGVYAPSKVWKELRQAFPHHVFPTDTDPDRDDIYYVDPE